VAGNLDAASGVSTTVAAETSQERQLVERARGGDVRAYEDLVRLHQQLAFRTACVLAGSPADAEEAVQDAFVSAWGALGRFRAGAPFRPWLLAIVANEARDRSRASGRRRAWTERAVSAERSLGATSASSAEVALLAHEQRATLLQALERLPTGDRAVIELRYLLDLSETEMAAVLRCRPGTVKSRLSRALERLRSEIGESL